MHIHTYINKVTGAGALLVLPFLLLTVPPASAASGYSGTWKGQSAEATFSDDYGGGRVSLFQTGSGAYLNFALWENDPTSYICVTVNGVDLCSYTRVTYTYGWGPVAASGYFFTASSAGLNTVISGNTLIRCSLDRAGATPVTTCAPGSTRSFSLTWSVNGIYTTAGSGPASETYGTYSIKNGGGYKGSSAFVNGDVNGRFVTEAAGELRDTDGKSITNAITPN